MSTDSSQGQVQLLGFLGYATVALIENSTSWARLAPALADRVALDGMAIAHFDRFGLIADELDILEAPVAEALAPYQKALDDFGAALQPQDWPEAMTLLTLTVGLLGDFCIAVRHRLPSELVRVIGPGVTERRLLEFSASAVGRQVKDVEDLPGRLAMLGRRVAGEMVSQGQRIAVRDAELTALISGESGQDGGDLAVVSDLLERLVANNARRMASLGLG